jgi:hypothetical protein
MGGLISLYALVQHPGVFGAAGCVSTHWPMSTQPAWIRPPGDPRAAQAQQALRDWLAERLPPPGSHRLYFDHGTVNLDALYPPLQAQVDAVLAARGWQRGTHFTSLQFDGGDHNEAAWRSARAVPLQTLRHDAPLASVDDRGAGALGRPAWPRCAAGSAGATDTTAQALLLHVPSPDWRDQVIYFVLTDRFDDGDPSNNDQGAGEYNPASNAHYNGGDFAGLQRRLDYIRGLGATALWITAPVANQWCDGSYRATTATGRSTSSRWTGTWARWTTTRRCRTRCTAAACSWCKTSC